MGKGCIRKTGYDPYHLFSEKTVWKRLVRNAEGSKDSPVCRRMRFVRKLFPGTVGGGIFRRFFPFHGIGPQGCRRMSIFPDFFRETERRDFRKKTGKGRAFIEGLIKVREILIKACETETEPGYGRNPLSGADRPDSRRRFSRPVWRSVGGGWTGFHSGRFFPRASAGGRAGNAGRVLFLAAVRAFGRRCRTILSKFPFQAVFRAPSVRGGT